MEEEQPQETRFTRMKSVISPSFTPGMRIVKTVIAAFICMVIDYFRDMSPYQTVITTVICMQTDPEKSLSLAMSRMVGTVIGAFYGVIFTLAVNALPFTLHPLVHYLLICVLMVYLIHLLTSLQSPRGVVISIVLYLSIALGRNTDTSFWLFTMNRMLDTSIGIIVALVVNIMLPRKGKEKDDKILDFSKVDALGVSESFERRREKKALRLLTLQEELEEEYILLRENEMEASDRSEKELAKQRVFVKEKEAELKALRESMKKLENMEDEL